MTLAALTYAQQRVLFIHEVRMAAVVAAVVLVLVGVAFLLYRAEEDFRREMRRGQR